MLLRVMGWSYSFFFFSISDIYPATPNMVYAVSHFWGGQKKCVLGTKSGLMRCHPNSFFFFSFFCCLIFLCFSRITWAMGYSIFFQRKILFYFDLCFFRACIGTRPASCIASGRRRVIRLLIFFFWDDIILFFLSSILGTYRTLQPAPFPFLLVDHDEVDTVHFLGNIIGLGLVARVWSNSLGCVGAGLLSSTE